MLATVNAQAVMTVRVLSSWPATVDITHILHQLLSVSGCKRWTRIAQSARLQYVAAELLHQFRVLTLEAAQRLGRHPVRRGVRPTRGSRNV